MAANTPPIAECQTTILPSNHVPALLTVSLFPFTVEPRSLHGAAAKDHRMRQRRRVLRYGRQVPHRPRRHGRSVRRHRPTWHLVTRGYRPGEEALDSDTW